MTNARTMRRRLSAIRQAIAASIPKRPGRVGYYVVTCDLFDEMASQSWWTTMQKLERRTRPGCMWARAQRAIVGAEGSWKVPDVA